MTSASYVSGRRTRSGDLFPEPSCSHQKGISTRRRDRRRTAMSQRTFHVWLTSLALTLLWPRGGAAQLAPTGAHYAGRPSDTGHAGPNDRGGYAATIPLDLPPARGGLPIPLQIVSGTRGFGAAGVGWDTPLSSVYVDRTLARRRPVMDPGERPMAREQVTLSLPGRQI